MINWLKEKLGLKGNKRKLSTERIAHSTLPMKQNEEIHVEQVDLSRLENNSSDLLTDTHEDSKRETFEAQEYLIKLNGKITTLAERFAKGDLNRRQFESLHDHYRKEIDMIVRAMELPVDQQDWKKMVHEGQSILIRRANAARMVAFAIFSRNSLQMLLVKGDGTFFATDFSPVLNEVMNSAEGRSERGYLLKNHNQRNYAFIFGQRTLTSVMLSTEPSRRQLDTLMEMQAVFETANQHTLGLDVVPNHLLVVPFTFFLGKEL